MNRVICITILLLVSVSAYSQVSLVEPDLLTTTKIAPAYFGPNAFPVPDMLDGTTSDELKLEFATDYYPGYRGDKTSNIFFKAVVPLFTDRVNLSVWVTPVEYYTRTE